MKHKLPVMWVETRKMTIGANIYAQTLCMSNRSLVSWSSTNEIPTDEEILVAIEKLLKSIP